MATSNTEFDELTLAELHDKAKEAGLTGTSHMKKEELIEALSSGNSDTKASATGQYDDMTLAELHDKAKEAGLTGTSHMKKEELIEALNSGDNTSHAKSGADDSKTAKSHSTSHDNADRPRDDKGHFEKETAKR